MKFLLFIGTLCKSHANKENTQQGSNPVPAGTASAACPSSGDTVKEGASSWSPLLLIIPLRLGLTDINSLYFNSLKVSVTCSDFFIPCNIYCTSVKFTTENLVYLK